MAYSMGHRQAVAWAYDECGSSAGVAEDFGCSASRARRLTRHGRGRGTLEPTSTAHHAGLRTYDDADGRAIRERTRVRADATPAEVAAALGEPAGTTAVSRTLERPGPPPGERVVSFVPHGHWKMISTVAAMTTRGVAAGASSAGATDTDTSVASVADALVHAPRPGDAAVTGNLAPHKAPAVRRLTEAAGATLLPLPPYSPDFSPTGTAFSKAKGVLRSMASGPRRGSSTPPGSPSPASRPKTHTTTSRTAAMGYDGLVALRPRDRRARRSSPVSSRTASPRGGTA